MSATAPTPTDSLIIDSQVDGTTDVPILSGPQTTLLGPSSLLRTRPDAPTTVSSNRIVVTRTAHPSSSSPSATAPSPSSLSDSASHKSSPPIGPIVGGVIGGVCVLAIALGLILLRHRLQSRNRAHHFDPTEREAQTSGPRLRLAPPMISQANGNVRLLIGPERRTEATRRQEYLQGQVQPIQQELHDLQSTVDTVPVASASALRPGDGIDADVRRLVEQVEVMKAQIERLQGQGQSEWAQGLSDEPPPGYDTAGGRAGTITNL